MSLKVQLAEKSVTLAELETFYYSVAVSFVSGHDETSRGQLRQQIYEDAKIAHADIERLIESHEALQRQVRKHNR